MLGLFYLLNIIKEFITKIIVIIQITYYLNNTPDILVIHLFFEEEKEKICPLLPNLVVFFLNKISERSHLWPIPSFSNYLSLEKHKLTQPTSSPWAEYGCVVLC